MIITQQMIRDTLYYNGPSTALDLTRKMNLAEPQVFAVNRSLIELAKLGDVDNNFDSGQKLWKVSESIKTMLDISNKMLLG